MAVEWIRSCYSSRWKLFRDDPARTTAGRYYFVDDETPFYPGVHNLGSANWNDHNWLIDVKLGEIDPRTPQWFPGTAPAVSPRNIVLGSADCLQNGEIVANGIPVGDLQAGFPAGCYVPDVPLDPIWNDASSYLSCSLQYFYAKIIEWTYAGDITAISQAFALLVGNAPVVRYHPGNPVFPGVTTVVTPQWSIMVSNGTDTYQQAATEVFLGIQPPTNVGIFSASLLWYGASSYVNNLLIADGVVPGTPIFLVGQSYGGAIALLLAARYRNADVTREIRYLAYGTPKPGDSRVTALVNLCDGMHLANDNDLITVLPPDNLLLLPVTPLFPLVNLLPWTDWSRSGTLAVQDVNGNLAWNANVLISTATLILYTVRAIANQPLDPILGHHLSEYIDRILRRCPEREWPVSPQLWDFLHDAVAILPLGGNLDGVQARNGLAIGFDVPGAGIVLGAGEDAADAGIVLGAGEDAAKAGLALGAGVDRGLIQLGTNQLTGFGLNLGYTDGIETGCCENPTPSTLQLLPWAPVTDVYITFPEGIPIQSTDTLTWTVAGADPYDVDGWYGTVLNDGVDDFVFKWNCIGGAWFASMRFKHLGVWGAWIDSQITTTTCSPFSSGTFDLLFQTGALLTYIHVTAGIYG